MTNVDTTTPPPDIVLTRSDVDRLDALLEGVARNRIGKVADFLLNEIVRAQVVDDADVEPDVIVLGSTARFRDDRTGEVTAATLVFPGERAWRGLAVSVLTPVGAALLGLSAGQSMAYETPDGRLKSFTVIEVFAPASLAER